MLSASTFEYIFFFNETATTEIYTTTDTLSLHDALPIYPNPCPQADSARRAAGGEDLDRSEEHTSELQSPVVISYAVFCLKKKKTVGAARQRREVDQRAVLGRVLAALAAQVPLTRE